MDSWEIVSDIASVLSLDGLQFAGSYAEITKLPPHLPVTVSTEAQAKKSVQWKRSPKKETPEKDDSGEFDALFVMEGVKGARGGKATLMFKGNPRTPKPRKSKKERKRS